MLHVYAAFLLLEWLIKSTIFHVENIELIFYIIYSACYNSSLYDGVNLVGNLLYLP